MPGCISTTYLGLDPLWRTLESESKSLVYLLLIQDRFGEIPKGRRDDAANCPLNSHASFLDFLGGAIHRGCPGSADL